MKYNAKLIFSILVFLFLSKKGMCQDSITIYFSSEENNKQVHFCKTEYNSAAFAVFKIEKENMPIVLKVPIQSIMYDTLLRFRIFLKRRFWFGWARFNISEYYQPGKALVIYRSHIHKRKFRYVAFWSNSYPLSK